MQLEAILKSGVQCKYPSKKEYGRYCGVHKYYSKNNHSKGKDERLVLLVSAGASMVTLLEKALEYLPPVIEVITQTNNFGFLRAEEGRGNNQGEYTKSKVFTSLALNHVRSSLKDKNMHQLYISLHNDFDHVFNRVDLPKELYSSIYFQRRELLKTIEINGYKPSEELLKRLSVPKKRL